MANISYSSTIRLRFDTEQNFALIKDSFIPASGEICFVKLASGEIKFKLGDGASTFAELDYVSKYLETQIQTVNVRGYYYNGEFYVDKEHRQKYVPYNHKLYIENDTKKIYSYTGTAYEVISEVQNATSEIAGIAKLYNSLGSNIDGSITQNCITANLNKKVEMGLEEETLILIDNK